MRYRKGLVNRKVKTAVLELLYVTADSTGIEQGSFESSLIPARQTLS